MLRTPANRFVEVVADRARTVANLEQMARDPVERRSREVQSCVSCGSSEGLGGEFERHGTTQHTMRHRRHKPELIKRD